MQPIGGFDPGAGPNRFSLALAANGGRVVLTNLSPYGVLMEFGADATEATRNGTILPP